MLREFADFLYEIGKADKEPNLRLHEALPNQVILSDRDETKVLEAGPRPYCGQLNSYESIIEFCKQHTNAEIYIDGVNVRILLDRNSRREYMVCPLELAGVWRVLRDITIKQQKFKVQDVRRLLRVGFGVDAAHPLYTALGKIDFRRTNTGKFQAEHGKESLGRSVESEAQSTESIPENFSVHTPVFNTPGFDHYVTLDVGVWVHADSEQIELYMAKPDALQLAHLEVTEKSLELLRNDSGVPVYWGKFE